MADDTPSMATRVAARHALGFSSNKAQYPVFCGFQHPALPDLFLSNRLIFKTEGFAGVDLPQRKERSFENLVLTSKLMFFTTSTVSVALDTSSKIIPAMMFFSQLF